MEMEYVGDNVMLDSTNPNFEINGVFYKCIEKNKTFSSEKEKEWSDGMRKSYNQCLNTFRDNAIDEAENLVESYRKILEKIEINTQVELNKITSDDIFSKVADVCDPTYIKLVRRYSSCLTCLSEIRAAKNSLKVVKDYLDVDTGLICDFAIIFSGYFGSFELPKGGVYCFDVGNLSYDWIHSAFKNAVKHACFDNKGNFVTNKIMNLVVNKNILKMVEKDIKLNRRSFNEDIKYGYISMSFMKLETISKMLENKMFTGKVNRIYENDPYDEFRSKNINKSCPTGHNESSEDSKAEKKKKLLKDIITFYDRRDYQNISRPLKMERYSRIFLGSSLGWKYSLID